MAGLLKPRAATLLVGALRARFPDLPIHLHTHDTAGTGVATQLAAAAAGADILDCCIDSMAGTTSQPSMGALVHSLAGTELDTGVDPGELLPLVDFWDLTRGLYAPFESTLRSPSSEVYYHEMPGGQYTNLKFQSMSLGLGEEWQKVKDAYAAANRALGNIVSGWWWARRAICVCEGVGWGWGGVGWSGVQPQRRGRSRCRRCASPRWAAPAAPTSASLLATRPPLTHPPPPARPPRRAQVKVTPSSKVVGDLAQCMVANNIADEHELVAKAASLSLPDSVVEFLQGFIGRPAGGFPEPLRSRVVKDRPVVEGRPGASLPPVSLADLQTALREKHEGARITPRDVLSAALYPKVFDEYRAFVDEFSTFVERLPTRAFLAPLDVDEDIDVEVRARGE